MGKARLSGLWALEQIGLYLSFCGHTVGGWGRKLAAWAKAEREAGNGQAV